MPLNFILTNAGKAAIVSANNTGTNPVVITQIAVGSNSWTPTASATALSSEIKRISAVGGSAVADDTIHITGTDSSADVYAVKEVGLYTDGGVLLAVYSQPVAIITKASATIALLAADLVLTGVPAGSVTVGDIYFSYPPATETVKGVMRFATYQEVYDTTITDKAVSPASLRSLQPTTLRPGLMRNATADEVLNASSVDCALTPTSMPTVYLYILQKIYPIGELLVTRRSGDPSTWLGFGTWQRYSQGKVLVGLQSDDSDFSLVDLTGGQKNVTLVYGEMPVHSHFIIAPPVLTSSDGIHSHVIDLVAETGSNVGKPRMATSENNNVSRVNGATSSNGSHSHVVSLPEFTSVSAGAGGSHNNLQPYTVVNMWVRTA